MVAEGAVEELAQPGSDLARLRVRPPDEQQELLLAGGQREGFEGAALAVLALFLKQELAQVSHEDEAVEATIVAHLLAGGRLRGVLAGRFHLHHAAFG